MTAPIPKLADLSSEQRRVLIAEACGWRFEPMKGPLELPWRKPNCEAWDGHAWSGRAAFLPDYLTSLDAMHLAEQTLTDEDGWNSYVNRLEEITSDTLDSIESETSNVERDFRWVTATADHRAAAFLIATGRATL